MDNTPGSFQNFILNPQQELFEASDMPYDRGSLASNEVIDETCELYVFHLFKALSFNSETNEGVTNSRNEMALRKLSSKFVVSPQRIKIHEQAQTVDLTALNYNTFHQLLSSIFQESDGQEPWERVLTVFYFCSDLSLRSINQNNTYSMYIYNLTSCYLGFEFATWVEKEGGWLIILQTEPDPSPKPSLISYATRLSILGFCCISVLAICIYIRNR